VAGVLGTLDQSSSLADKRLLGTSLLVLVMFWILTAWIGGFFRHLKIATPENSDNNLAVSF
jgi:H+-transporting ATPase